MLLIGAASFVVLSFWAGCYRSAIDFVICVLVFVTLMFALLKSPRVELSMPNHATMGEIYQVQRYVC